MAESPIERIESLESRIERLEAEITGRVKIFGMNGSSSYAHAVAERLGLRLSQHEEKRHADGECYVRSLDNVRRSKAFVIASIYRDSEESPDEKLMKLLWFIGSLRDASADEITAVIRYYPYARQDRKVKSREGVTTKYLAQCLEAVGCDRILTIDIHNLGAYQNSNNRMGVDNLTSQILFAKYMADELSGIDPEKICVITPDSGGMERSRRFRNALSGLMGGSIAMNFVDKERQGDKVKAGQIVGPVRPIGIFLDDMISTATTVRAGTRAAAAAGIERVYVLGTHGLFVGNADENLSAPYIHKVVVTDTIDTPRSIGDTLRRKLTILSTVELFAEAIKRTYTGESLSSLFD